MSFTVEQLAEQGVDPIDAEQITIEMLNDCYDKVRIASLSFEAGDALKRLDPVAFREVINDYMDSLIDDETVVEIDGEYFWADALPAEEEEAS